MASPRMKSWLMLLAVGVNLLKRLLIPAYHVPESQPAQALKYVDQLAVAQIIHQKPKRKDWHPPDGFILGLWMLILLVFFKSYGLKQLKHIF